MNPRSILVAIALAAAMPACATSETVTTPWVGVGNWTRRGRVESIREITRRVRGDPAAGALLGALLGGILFHGRGPATLFGAATGAAVGAAVSSGSAESRSYQVLVRFDDGDYGMFVFADASPFGIGERVMLTPSGLIRP